MDAKIITSRIASGLVAVAMSQSLFVLPSLATDDSRALSSTARRIAIESTPPCLGWTNPDRQPTAVLLCLHELALHSGVFDDFAKKMAGRGFVTYSIDLRGFGSWQQARGKEKMSLDLTFKDTLATLKAIRKAHPDLPIFVLGEAMGGAMALKVATKYPDLVAGAISSAPGGEHFGMGRLIAGVGTRLAYNPNGKYPYGKQFIEMATPNAATRDVLEKDPMVRLELTPSECAQCQFFMFKTKGMARRIKKVPVLIVQGERDGMSKPIGAKRVFARVANKDKKLFMVKEGDHYVYESPDISNQIIDETAGWIDDHITSKKAGADTGKVFVARSAD